jgi:hypothetical protein
MDATKGNGLDATNDQPAKTNTKYTFDCTRFAGTNNPRHLRVITALSARPQTREGIDTTAGCSNGPELIAELRRRGLSIPCTRLNFLDRDGTICRPGVYHLTSTDRRKLSQWRTKRGANV